MIGIRSAFSIRARGPMAAFRGRIHDRSPIACRSTKKSLAERGPSIHDVTCRVWTCRNGLRISDSRLAAKEQRMTLQADFASQDYFRNPTAALEKLRKQGPVVEVRFPLIGKVWATTTQGLADQVLKDTATFTLRREDGNVAGVQWWMPGIVRTLANSMLSMDEPDHKRLRDIVDEAFRRRAVLEMEPHIQAIGDQLAAELFADGATADLIDRFARKLPLSVNC